MVESGSRFSARAETLFDDYLHRRAAGEDVDFEALCGAHPEVAGELRALRRAEQVLSRLLPGPLEGGSEHGAGPPGELFAKLQATGARGKRYGILGEVARGGMGTILRVWDDELRRNLAMKVLRGTNQKLGAESPEVDPKALGRFLEEAQVTSQLDHPGIVPVHEIGLGADGEVYYTMRLVQGVNLRTIFERVREGADDWTQVRALGLILKVCEAMSYAHSKGVIHRDLKPANVMVGEFGEVYVMDWGLARVLGRDDRHDLRIRHPSSAALAALETERRDQRDSAPDSPLITMDGDVVGTPSFMSPEQARGELERLGPHSDVYSVGAMLYQLISGQMPFAPPDASVTSRMVLEHLVQGPPRPLHEFGRTAPTELVAICDKAMSREIGDRYGDMAALAEDLRAYVEGRVVRAYETGTLAETRKWVRRNKPFAASLAVAVLILLGGVMLGLESLRQTRVRKEALERNEVISAMARLEEFQRQCSDGQFALDLKQSGHASAYDWWLATARRLVERPQQSLAPESAPEQDLTWIRSLLAKARQEAFRPSEEQRGADLASYPRTQELATKRLKLQWYSRMLEKEAWPSATALETELAGRPDWTDAKALNELAWSLVHPRAPRFGSEVRALCLARRAVDEAPDDESRLKYRDTYAWALYRVGRFNEAQAQRDKVLAKRPPLVWGTERKMPRMEDQIEDWHDGTAERLHDELAAEVASMERERADWRIWGFPDGEQKLWHVHLMELHGKLEELLQRIELAETAATTSEPGKTWEEAITAIRAHPDYGGLTISRQLDLVPLGPDPESTLWEFAHLPSGDPAKRGPDGKLALKRETGLVFVLLPGGRLPVEDGKESGPLNKIDLEPFFLSKYEMTQYQWTRINRDWPGRYWPDERTLLPANYVSWDDCVATLSRAGGWLRLPSEAQWEYGCRAGTTTPWWTGESVDSLKGAENLDFGENAGGPAFIRRVGTFGANKFGLYDVHGNVTELCQDPLTSLVEPLARGALRDEFPVTERVARGQAWNSVASKVRPSDPALGPPQSSDLSLGLRPARLLTP